MIINNQNSEVLSEQNFVTHLIEVNYTYETTSTPCITLQLEMKDTARSASYLDLYLEIDSDDRLRTKLYDKRGYFNFPIVNFPFICSNIPANGVVLNATFNNISVILWLSVLLVEETEYQEKTTDLPHKIASSTPRHEH